MGDFEARGTDGVGRVQGAALERALEWGPEPARREMPPGIVVRVVAAPSSSWCPVVSYKNSYSFTHGDDKLDPEPTFCIYNMFKNFWLVFRCLYLFKVWIETNNHYSKSSKILLNGRNFFFFFFFFFE